MKKSSIFKLGTILILTAIVVSLLINNVRAAEILAINSSEVHNVVANTPASADYAFSLSIAEDSTMEFFGNGLMIDDYQPKLQYVIPTNDSQSGNCGIMITNVGSYYGKRINLKCTFIWNPIPTINNVKTYPIIGVNTKERKLSFVTVNASYEVRYELLYNNSPITTDMSFKLSNIEKNNFIGFKANNGRIQQVECRSDCNLYYKNSGGYRWAYSDGSEYAEPDSGSIRFEINDTSSFNIIYGVAIDNISYPNAGHIKPLDDATSKTRMLEFFNQYYDYIRKNKYMEPPAWVSMTGEAYGPYYLMTPQKFVIVNGVEEMENTVWDESTFTYRVKYQVPCETTNFFYSVFRMIDYIPKGLEYVSSTITKTRTGEDVTDKFTFALTEQNQVITASSNYCDYEIFYEDTYIWDIVVRVDGDTIVSMPSYKQSENNFQIRNTAVASTDRRWKYENTTSNETITNFETVNIPLTKVWKDNSNAYRTRPATIVVRCYQNGTQYKIIGMSAEDLVQGDRNSWRKTVADLPKYDRNRNEYNYTFEEDTINLANGERYEVEINGSNIKNTLHDEIPVTFNKVWDDLDNVENLRSTSERIELYHDNVLYKTLTISNDDVSTEDSNKWTKTEENCPEYDEEGKRYIYTIKEIYSNQSYKEAEYNQQTLTATNKLKLTTMELNKTWLDDSDFCGLRPDEIQYHFFKDGSPYRELLLTKNDVTTEDSNKWRITTRNLPQYHNDGTPFEYTISEDQIVLDNGDIYVPIDVQTQSNASNALVGTITNLITGTRDIKISKIWDDNGDIEGLRSQNVSIKLLQNTNTIYDTITLNNQDDVTPEDSNKWSKMKEDVNKYDDQGKLYQYTIEEIYENHSYYPTPTYDQENFTVTNTIILYDRDFTKTWLDDSDFMQLRPDEAIFHLYKDDSLYRELLLTKEDKLVDDSNKWKITAKNLPKYFNNGDEIPYTITEDVITLDNGDWYAPSTSGDNITNLIQGFVEQNISIKWDDENNRYDTRPDTLNVIIVQNGTDFNIITLSAANQLPDDSNEWKKGEQVPKYDNNGVLYSYTIREDTTNPNLVNFYKEITEDSYDQTTGTITNIGYWVGDFNYKVAFEKQILNDKDEEVSDEDLVNYGLKETDAYDFEIILKEMNRTVENTGTKLIEHYDGFTGNYYNGQVNTAKNYEIDGISYGKYEIVEPEAKYFDFIKFESVRNTSGVLFEEEDGRYYVTISGLSAQDEDSLLKVVNRLNIDRPDLVMKKFVSRINKTRTPLRMPVFSIDENGKYIYDKTKTIFKVEDNDIVTYTLRVYNEGTMDGYAKTIEEEVPQGLLFLPEHSMNVGKNWIMYDAEGNETLDFEKCKKIVTNYLSYEANGEKYKIRKFNEEDFLNGTIKEPDYAEIEIAFKVEEPKTEDRSIVNKGTVLDIEDRDGEDTIEIDAIRTDTHEPNFEDNTDEEKVIVKKFDLSLYKWTKDVRITTNGNTKTVETGHTAEQDPEPTTKVQLPVSDLDTSIVKFRYGIKIKNVGEIPGFATKITDYIPQGLAFNEVDNPDWYLENNYAVTNKLMTQLLNPGESAEIEIVLTWKNANNNLGKKLNIAGISGIGNSSGSPDVDSTNNTNNKQNISQVEKINGQTSIVTHNEPVVQRMSTDPRTVGQIINDEDNSNQDTVIQTVNENEIPSSSQSSSEQENSSTSTDSTTPNNESRSEIMIYTDKETNEEKNSLFIFAIAGIALLSGIIFIIKRLRKNNKK